LVGAHPSSRRSSARSSSPLASVAALTPGRTFPRPPQCSSGRPTWSPRQNGIRAACPGAGVTITRSWVMSSTPRRRAQQNTSRRATRNHLLVQLAHRERWPRSSAGVITVNRPEAVGMGVPPAGHRDRCSPGLASALAGDPVPRDPLSPLPKSSLGIATLQHVQHRVAAPSPRQRGEGRRSARRTSWQRGQPSTARWPPSPRSGWANTTLPSDFAIAHARSRQPPSFRPTTGARRTPGRHGTS